MSELEAFFAGFGGYVAQPSAEGLRAWRAANPEWDADPERIAIYGRHARLGVTGLLPSIFDKTQALFSEERWRELGLAFYAQRPARDRYELNSLAEGFAEFLRAQPNVHPAAADVAAAEWACFAVYQSAVELPKDPTELAVNPTLVTLSSAFHVCGYLSGRREQPDEGAEIVFVFRNPKTLRARYQSATDRTLLALKLVVESIPLAEAAQGETTEDDLRAVLREACSEGLILGEVTE